MRLTQQQLEAHLWGAANILRGKTAGQDYKNYILSLMFYKRLCDQWENEAEEAIAELERQQGRSFTEAQKAIFRARGEHRFNISDGSRWGDVLDASGKKLIPNEVVHALIQHFDEHDLSNRSVPPDILGRAYEYLIKQFADDAGAKAGEFFTPPEVVDTLVRILEPRPGDTIYERIRSYSPFLTALQQLKKSLMHDLLTGKVRVDLSHGGFQVPASFFEPLPDDLLDAFEGR